MLERLNSAVERHPFLIIGGGFIFLLIALGVSAFLIINTVDNGNVAVDISPAVEDPIDVLDEGENASLYFYDFESGCSLDGDVYFGSYFAGESEEGILVVNINDYYQEVYQGVNVRLVGDTGGCFGDNAAIPFEVRWIMNSDNYYVNSGKSLEFEAKISPRKPTAFNPRSEFIRNEEVQEVYSEIEFRVEDTVREDLDRIYSASKIDWVADSEQFGVEDYWQTPAEVFENKEGDCEDWTIYFMSLLKEYDSDLECYALVWPTHMNVLCYLDDEIVLYDQEMPSEDLSYGALTEENVLDFKEELIDYYNFELDESELTAVFNWGDGKSFSEEDSFVDWVLEQNS